MHHRKQEVSRSDASSRISYITSERIYAYVMLSSISDKAMEAIINFLSTSKACGWGKPKIVI